LSEDEEERLSDLPFVAPNLEAFVYRYGLEDEIWFSLNQWADASWVKREITGEQQSDLNHYKKPNANNLTIAGWF
jgi:hypothetical protein